MTDAGGPAEAAAPAKTMRSQKKLPDAASPDQAGEPAHEAPRSKGAKDRRLNLSDLTIRQRSQAASASASAAPPTPAAPPRGPDAKQPSKAADDAPAASSSAPSSAPRPRPPRGQHTALPPLQHPWDAPEV